MVVAFDIETTGLNPRRDKIVLIGMKKGRIKQWKLWKIRDELRMVSECIEAIKEIPSLDETIVGYNNLKFDVPFIRERLLALGSPIEPSNLLDTLYRRRKWFDLYQFLGNDFRNLTFWLREFKIKRKYEEVDGRQMPILYKNQQFKKIEQHNRDDLNTSMKLYLKLKRRFPQLLPEH